MVPALAQMIVIIPAALVIEPHPELLVVLCQLDLQRLARRQTLARLIPVRLRQEGERQFGCLRENLLLGRLRRDADDALGAADVLARAVAVAAVDTAAGPDANHVALARAAGHL